MATLPHIWRWALAPGPAPGWSVYWGRTETSRRAPRPPQGRLLCCPVRFRTVLYGQMHTEAVPYRNPSVPCSSTATNRRAPRPALAAMPILSDEGGLGPFRCSLHASPCTPLPRPASPVRSCTVQYSTALCTLSRGPCTDLHGPATVAFPCASWAHCSGS